LRVTVVVNSAGSYHVPRQCQNPGVSDPKTPQLDLFPSAEPREPRRSPERERLEREHADAARIAARLPPNVRFGTSTWSFPDWAGIVYSRRTSVTELAREGLAEYARHPLLTTVGIDRSYYAPIPREDLRRYAGQLPAGFPCCAKAPEAVTSAVQPARSKNAPRGPNPDFLNPVPFLEEMLGPFADSFREHTGPFVFQFPPAPASLSPGPREFAERLDRFLGALPGDFQYAVELRDASLLTPEYRSVLARHGVAHVLNYVTAMPMPAAQAETVPIEAAPFAVIRLLLPPGTRYAERGQALKPFERLGDPDDEMRSEVVALARRAVAAGIPVSVLVNNKAEGCAPLTIRALAELLADSAVG
jgi:uncharacterized protein YecE (DUF72 family)